MKPTKEMVLYYNPESSKNGNKIKGVLVRMGVRIKNVTPQQIMQQVGYLVGMDGFVEKEASEPLPIIEEAMLIMKDFSSRRIDELLMGLRKAGVPRIQLKAVINDYNKHWTFFELYEELKKENEAMTKKEG